jgi:hypothetical protein
MSSPDGKRRVVIVGVDVKLAEISAAQWVP